MRIVQNDAVSTDISPQSIALKQLPLKLAERRMLVALGRSLKAATCQYVPTSGSGQIWAFLVGHSLAAIVGSARLFLGLRQTLRRSSMMMCSSLIIKRARR